MKNRLTITLSNALLDRVDQLVDRKKIRNRSHAIEFLLEKSLKPSINTAVLLAGGDREQDALKPLKGLNEKPLILHTLELLKTYGVIQLIIATNESGKQLQSLLGDGHEQGISIRYVFETAPLGTAGAIKNIAAQLPSSAFFVLAGDVLTTINLQELAAFHLSHHALATMAVKPRPTHKTYDNVFVQGNQVVNFQKSRPDETVSIVNTGVYVFDPEILKYIPEKTPAMLETEVFPQLARQKKLIAFPFQGMWFDISIDTSYQDALKKLKH